MSMAQYLTCLKNLTCSLTPRWRQETLQRFTLAQGHNLDKWEEINLSGGKPFGQYKSHVKMKDSTSAIIRQLLLYHLFWQESSPVVISLVATVK
jgi:hypothetical protein